MAALQTCVHPLTGLTAIPTFSPVSSTVAKLHFEQVGSTLTAVEITREARSPVIASVHRALFALGIIVASYQVRAESTRIVERVVLERSDGKSIDGELSAATKAAIVPIALS